MFSHDNKNYVFSCVYFNVFICLSGVACPLFALLLGITEKNNNDDEKTFGCLDNFSHTQSMYISILPTQYNSGACRGLVFLWEVFLFAREDFLTTTQVNSLPPHLFSQFIWGGKEFTWGVKKIMIYRVYVDRVGL